MLGTPKGLATIAFLKARLDEGHDHLGLFEPLITDALLQTTAKDFDTEHIKVTVFQRTGIQIPVNTVKTLLQRFVSRKMLTRDAGRFLKTGVALPSASFEPAREAAERQLRELGAAFMRYSADEGVAFESEDAALKALATFVSDNKVPMLLGEPLPDSPLERSTQDRKTTRTIARFITERAMGKQSAFRESLTALVEGMLLQDVLLLKDIESASSRFKNLTVLLDTPVLLAAIDMTGVANAVAIKEGLSLVREAGAKTAAFTKTVSEMRQILAMYEGKLATNSGRLSLRPTPMTQHIFAERLTPADIRIVSASLEARLSGVGISVINVPKHDPDFTLDEVTLANALKSDEQQDVDSPRIRHDVDCIAGVLTLRSGCQAGSLERSIAIFSTTSGQVVATVQKWFADEQQTCFPPIIHHAALTTIAWLKKPAAAPNLKLHELAALCFAAMRPTKATWDKLLKTLQKLKQEGHITDDETVAVVASELTEPSLSRLDDDFDPDASSLEEVIERVREDYRQKAAKAAEHIAINAQAEASRREIAAADAVRLAQSKARLAEDAASDANDRSSKTIGNLEAVIDKISTITAETVFWLLVILLLVAAVLSLPGVFEDLPKAVRWIAWGLLGVCGLWGVYAVAMHRGLPHVCDGVKTFVAGRLKKLFFEDKKTAKPGDILGI